MFIDHSQKNPPIAAPSGRLLAIHAAFAWVFNASGALEYVDNIWRDPFAGKQLSSNGSSDVIALIHAVFANRL